MSWKDRAAAIVEKAPMVELTELTKLPREPQKGLLSVLSVPTGPHSAEISEADRAELTRLVCIVATANGWNQADRDEALAVALEHGQLEMFRALAGELEASQEAPERPEAVMARPKAGERQESGLRADPGYLGHTGPVRDCMGCGHIQMEQHTRIEGRRGFMWACDAGHRPLVIAWKSESVLTAPPNCSSYARWRDPGAVHGNDFRESNA